MKHTPEGPENDLPTNIEGSIELSPDEARETINAHMREVFGNDGDSIDPEKPFDVVS